MVLYRTRTEEEHNFKNEKYNDLIKQLKHMAAVNAKVIAVELEAR